MNRNLELSDLLLSLFNPYELRRYLTSGNQGDSIRHTLPGTDAPPQQLADAGVSALETYALPITPETVACRGL